MSALPASIMLLDPGQKMFHEESVLRNGTPFGEVRAAEYGHTLGGSAGLAMVHRQAAGEAFIERGNWTVDSAGNIFPARVSPRPLYTPGMQRIRA